MSAPHPNIALLSSLNLADMTQSADVFAEDAVFHYINPKLPDLEGDYHGFEAICGFFATLGERTGGTFRVNVIDARPVGDELVFVQTRNEMTLDGVPLSIDVALIWRIVDGRIRDVWDIPAVFTDAS